MIIKSRVRKMIAFLRKLEPAKFDIGLVNSSNFSQHSCGTAGCIAGYLPEVFPRLCRYDDRGNFEVFYEGDWQRVEFQEAFTVVFGCDEIQAGRIIYGISYLNKFGDAIRVTPKIAAKRMQKVLLEKDTQ